MGRFSSFLGKRKFMDSPTKGITTMGVMGAAVDGVATTAFDQMENPDNSMAWSATKGAATGAAWLFAEPLMWGITLGGLAKDGLGMAYEEAKYNRDMQRSLDYKVTQQNVDHKGNRINGGTLGGDFQDNEQTYTMRQRQMDLLRKHRMSTESILGSEARQLHR